MVFVLRKYQNCEVDFILSDTCVIRVIINDSHGGWVRINRSLVALEASGSFITFALENIRYE